MDIHGGNIYKFQREGKREILDYSSNINPLGVPKSLKEGIKNNISLLERYPDVHYVELRESIGEYNHISSDNIIVGNGATEVLFLYMKALLPKRALIISPTFAEYERALKNIDCEIGYFKLDENIQNEKRNFYLDVEKLKREAINYQLIVLCNPNNPTGSFVKKEILEELNEFLETNNIKLFVDECFLEFVEGWEEKTLNTLKSKNIFILRALTKYFALPGIRLGYGITYDNKIIEKINSIKEPWTVNAFADLSGKIILKDKEYIGKTDNWIKNERVRFVEELKKVDYIEVYETYTNFVLLKIKNMKAEEFQKRLLEKNILVRNCSNFKFLSNNFVRIAIKDTEKNNIFLKSIKNL